MNKQWLLLLLLFLQTGVTFLADTGVACTDHSDCTVLGHRYGCLLYRCADYTDTSLVHCTTKEDCCTKEGAACQQGQEYTCVRTYLPPYPEGVCQLSSSLQACSSKDDCPGTPGLTDCCGEWCCPTEYYSQWRNFSCFSHLQCRAWSTGQYCCPDNICCHSLPDYQDYYDYDYDTHMYTTTDTDTTTDGYNDNYEQYHVDTTTRYIDEMLANGENDISINTANSENEVITSDVDDNESLSGHETDTSDTVIQTETVDVKEDVKNDEKYIFFPVNDFILQNKFLINETEEEVSINDQREEVEIVSLQNGSEQDDLDNSLNRTPHYEIINNKIDSHEISIEENSAEADNKVLSIGDDITSLENTDDEIKEKIIFFPTEHVLLTFLAKNITDNNIDSDTEASEILEENSPVTFSSVTTAKDAFDNYADEVSIFTSNMTEELIVDSTSEATRYDTASELSDLGSGYSNVENMEFETVTESSKYEGSGLEFSQEADGKEITTLKSVFVEEIEDYSSEHNDVIIENSGDYSIPVVEKSGSGDYDGQPEEKEVTNIKSVVVKVNVKSADNDHNNPDNDNVKNKLQFQTPKEFVSDITRHIESGGEGLNVWSEDQDMFDSHSGAEQSEHNLIMLSTCLIALSLNLKFSFQK